MSEQRTKKQNSSLHLYFAKVAEALCNEGITFQNMVQKIERMEVMPTEDNVKLLFQEMCHAMYGSHKTSKLHTDEVGKVYDMFNLWLGENFHLHTPFPSYDGLDQLTEKDI